MNYLKEILSGDIKGMRVELKPSSGWDFIGDVYLNFGSEAMQSKSGAIGSRTWKGITSHEHIDWFRNAKCELFEMPHITKNLEWLFAWGRDFTTQTPDREWVLIDGKAETQAGEKQELQVCLMGDYEIPVIKNDTGYLIKYQLDLPNMCAQRTWQ